MMASLSVCVCTSDVLPVSLEGESLCLFVGCVSMSVCLFVVCLSGCVFSCSLCSLLTRLEGTTPYSAEGKGARGEGGGGAAE